MGEKTRWFPAYSYFISVRIKRKKGGGGKDYWLRSTELGIAGSQSQERAGGRGGVA